MSDRRVLLILPTSTYRAEDFVAAAASLGVRVVAASEQPSTMEANLPDRFLTIDLRDPEAAVRTVVEFAADYPIDAVVGVDEASAVAGAAIATALGVPGHGLEAAQATRNKAVMRQLLKDAGVASPAFRLLTLDDDAQAIAHSLDYPVVAKPTILSASQGVIRANDPAELQAAIGRISALLEDEHYRSRGAAAREILVEEYVPGVEVALEGLVVGGALHVLALFDKPDPLEGPFFEETIYVTPSRLSDEQQEAVASVTADGCAALGLREGPVHAELRLHNGDAWVIEIAGRSIGGLCSRTLRFGLGISLEELILRHALGMELPLNRERTAAGVMMIPVSRAGVYGGAHGLDAAQAVAGIEDIVITLRKGQSVVPLPEGDRYLGFLFARGDSPDVVEDALRRSHALLSFDIHG